MTEIKVEKKTPIWPWILAALIIAALIYFLTREDEETNHDEVEVEETSMLQEADHDATIATYEFVISKEMA